MLEQALENALTILSQQSLVGLALMFSYIVLLEVPRYGLSVVALALVRFGKTERPPRPLDPAGPFTPRVSIAVAGLNEANSIEKCVASLRAQSYTNLEIIVVSDGSTDRMPQIAQDLVARGLVDKAFATDFRCGKSSGVNLAARYATGDILINVDCDCSYDRFAIQRIVDAFADPSIGVACGDILPRNGSASMVASFQAIEYLLSISIGKRIGAMFEQVVCASGAFSAFRRSAIVDNGFLDAGGGEDLDVTMRLRRQGWRVAFVHDAICYTDVPTSSWALVRQRMRWERDSVRVRFRKHRDVLKPFSPAFRGSEALHQYDFLIFGVVLTMVFPLYVVWFFLETGPAALYLLMAAQLGMFFLETTIFLIAIFITRRWSYMRYLYCLPGYSLFNTFVMRGVRIAAYLHEWVFEGSRRDSHYLPLRVQKARQW
jgi:cellulose synthase/poly-beta-1,6-N-acetylglucosamine synthase-like glycosyltransferase